MGPLETRATRGFGRVASMKRPDLEKFGWDQQKGLHGQTDQMRSLLPRSHSFVCWTDMVECQLCAGLWDMKGRPPVVPAFQELTVELGFRGADRHTD